MCRRRAGSGRARPLGDSDRMEIGDFVLAVGSPFGLSHSVTFGIISAKGRRDLELGDAAVKLPGLSADRRRHQSRQQRRTAVNLRGEVIGINTAIASNSGGNEGIGFSIPINMFMAVARQLIDTGRVTAGVPGREPRRELRPGHGRRVRPAPADWGPGSTGITPNSPADGRQLQPGDVILEFDGTPIEDDAHLMNLVSLTEVGKTGRRW